MSKFHSTVSRRTFMKGLGLAGAGLGAAAAAAPVFHDLDELIAAPTAYSNTPWWIKELEPNTASSEIDWSIMPPLSRLARGYQTAEVKAQLHEIAKPLKLQAIQANTPGLSLRDVALVRTGWGFRRAGVIKKFDSFLGDQSSYTETPQEIGIPRWQGTPEENSRMVRAAFKFFGAAEVGFYELDTDKRDQLVDPSKYRWEDCDQPYKDGNIGVIPNKCKYVIVYLMRMSEEVARGDFTAMSDASVGFAYAQGGTIPWYLFEFMRGIGYIGLDRSAGLPVANGILAGSGELGRAGNLISPDYGMMVRYTPGMLTDLPVAPTRPIDAGMFRFCSSCKRCAEICPSGALRMETEPSWDVFEWNGEPVNRVGVKCYKTDYATCWPYRGNGGASLVPTPERIAKWGLECGRLPTECGECHRVCVFNKDNMASIHQVVKATLAITPLFNGFFRTMDDTFNYTKKGPAEWWDQDLPTTYGLTERSRR